MSINIMDQMKDLLTDAVIGQITGSLGGDKSSILKGLTSAGGSVLAAAMGKASTEDGAKGLFDMLGDGSTLNNLAQGLGEGSPLLTAGSGIVSSLLGDKASSIIDLVSKDSGLNSSASSSLLSIGGGLIAGLLGKQKALGGGIGALTSLLGNQGSLLDKLLPNLGSLLGLGSLAGLTGKLGAIGGAAVGMVGDAIEGAGDLAGSAVDGVTGLAGDAVDVAGDVGGAAMDVAGDVGGAAVDLGTSAVKGGSSLIGKLLPLALLALLGLAAFTFMKSCGSDVVDTAGNAVEATAGAVVDTAAGAADLAGDAVEGAAGLAGDAVEGAVDVAAGTAELAGDAVEGAAGLAGDAVEGAVDVAAGTAELAGDAAEGVVDVAAGAAGAVGGALNSFGQAIGKLFSFDLPNGTSISIPEGGFESAFLNALKDGLKPGQNYVFDRLFFATGSATLNAESQDQINSAAAILKAYPDLKVTLRGHTDNTGNAATNQTLSEQRSAAVKAAVVAAGVNADRILTTGVASGDPIADNATEEGRRLNRRIDISASE